MNLPTFSRFSLTVLSSSLMFGAGIQQASANLLFSSDDFESGVAEDGPNGFTTGGIADWTTIGGGGGSNFGTFNPDSDGTWYNLTDLDDTSGTGGVVGTMDGPVAGYIFQGNAGDGFSRDLGTIEGDHLYTATLSISGQRTNGTDAFHGYTLEFYSGAVVLSTVSSNLAPATAFEDVALTWDTTSLPGGVSVNDPLSIRILSNGSGNYLDFDNFRIAEVAIPEPSAVAFGFLAAATSLLSRRRRK